MNRLNFRDHRARRRGHPYVRWRSNRLILIRGLPETLISRQRRHNPSSRGREASYQQRGCVVGSGPPL